MHKGEGDKYQDKGQELDKDKGEEDKGEEDKYQDKGEGEEDKYQDKREEWDMGEELECVVALREGPELG